MRILMMVAAVVVVGACNRGGGANNASANSAQPPAANSANGAAAAPANATASANTAAATAGPAGAMPAGFPANDPTRNGMDCYVYLSLAMQAEGPQSGYDDVAMQQSRDQWRSALRQTHSENETDQLVASNVNPLMDTPAAQRDAAANWCVQNAPEVDPEG